MKWYLEEEYSDGARLLRDAFVKGQVGKTVPSLMYYETLNALRYSKVYDEKELVMAAESMSKYGFDVWQPTGSVYRESGRISLNREISVYDAAYVALAEHLHVPLYTGDNDLVTRFPGRARHIKNFKE